MAALLFKHTYPAVKSSQKKVLSVCIFSNASLPPPMSMEKKKKKKIVAKLIEEVPKEAKTTTLD